MNTYFQKKEIVKGEQNHENSKEFFERLQSDADFVQEVAQKAQAKVDAGEKDPKVIWKSIAGDYSVELTDNELDEWMQTAAAELSDEELGKVAGGTTPAIIVTIGSVVVVVSKVLAD